MSDGAPMRAVPAPVTLGTARFEEITTSSCRVTHAWFPPHAVLHPHTHDRAICAVMLNGSFDSAIGRHRLECTPASVWTEPREERHANYVGKHGAEVLVLQPDPTRVDLYAAFDRLLDEVTCRRSGHVLVNARRVVAEMSAADPLRPLAIDALVIDMLITASRLKTRASGAASPAWLGAVRDMLHATFRSPPTLSELATTAGVSVSHLCHAFRHEYGTTVGEYVRHIRVERAAIRLVESRDTVSSIAAESGYADHSHFARECQRLLGMSPSTYRATRGRQS